MRYIRLFATALCVMLIYMMKKSDKNSIQTHTAKRWTASETSSVSLSVANEVPIALEYNCSTYAVMMATPADLEDFALGFSFSEGLIQQKEDLIGFHINHHNDAIILEMELTPERFKRIETHQRKHTVASGCGLCGKDSIDEIMRPLSPLKGGPTISGDVVQKALKALPDLQPLNKICGALHAAAFVSAEGDILMVREDIGRHNALDKLIGWLIKNAIDPKSGFVLMTSRCSYELVHKAIHAGITFLATISAPSAMAITLAQKANLTVLALVRDDAMQIYTDTAKRFKE